MLSDNKREFNEYNPLTVKGRKLSANNVLKEMRLQKLMSELDQECTVVYKATQRNEFKRLNKIYHHLREYKVLMEAMALPTAKKLLEDLALEYYRLARPELIKVEEGEN